jgi:hypothetical protein
VVNVKNNIARKTGWEEDRKGKGLTPGEMAINMKFSEAYCNAYCTVSILSADFEILYAKESGGVPRLNLGARVKEPRVDVLYSTHI